MKQKQFSNHLLQNIQILLYLHYKFIHVLCTLNDIKNIKAESIFNKFLYLKRPSNILASVGPNWLLTKSKSTTDFKIKSCKCNFAKKIPFRK